MLQVEAPPEAVIDPRRENEQTIKFNTRNPPHPDRVDCASPGWTGMHTFVIQKSD